MEYGTLCILQCQHFPGRKIDGHNIHRGIRCADWENTHFTEAAQEQVESIGLGICLEYAVAHTAHQATQAEDLDTKPCVCSLPHIGFCQKLALDIDIVIPVLANVMILLGEIPQPDTTGNPISADTAGRDVIEGSLRATCKLQHMDSTIHIGAQVAFLIGGVMANIRCTMVNFGNLLT